MSYNKYSKDFTKKSNAWNAAVSQFHDLSQSEAVNKLKNVRSAYTRFLKRKKSTPSGPGRDAVPTGRPFLASYFSASYFMQIRLDLEGLKI